MNEKTFAKNEVVFREGDDGTGFYRILEGTVGVYVNYGKEDQLKLTDLKAGEFFGEMAVIEAYPRSTTIAAEEDARVIEIPETDLAAYFTQEPDQILALLKHLSKRIRSLTADYDEVKHFLSDMKKSENTEKNESFFTKLKKYIGIYNAGRKSMEWPSVESLREQALADNLIKTVLPVEEYPAGTVIFKEGELANCMYAIHHGVVGIYTGYGTDQEVKLTDLYPGSFFGEMGMIDEEPRSASAVTEKDNTCVEIIRPEDLAALFRENPAEVDMLLRHMSHRLRRLTEDYLKACKEVSEAGQA